MALATALTGVLAAWYAVPRPPDLDVPRWFRTLLAHQLGDPARVDAEVPYDPLARWPERKVAHPGVEAVPGTPLPGERGRVDELAALDTFPERWAALFPASHARLTIDPPALSEDHDPARFLGPDAAWDADPDAMAREAERRLHARWVAVLDPRDGVPDLTPHVERFARVVPFDDDLDALAERLTGLVPDDDAAARLILLGTGRGTAALLRVLHDHIGLRDRVRGLVSVGGAIGGIPGDDGPFGEAGMKDWLDAHFRHEALDTEIVRRIPYLALQWVDRTADPPGAGGLPVRLARFPEPGFVGREPVFVEPFDLGVLWSDRAPVAEAVASLRVVTDLLVLSRG